MAQSLSRKLKRGNVVMIWNETMKKMDFFKRTSRGRFILASGSSGNFIARGPGESKHTIAKWQKGNES